ncbi:dihydrolipoyllysine-residue succinyltransferase component of 2-oxoglutarate dehydrogenase complex 1, mitochondrial isoform X2 [Selaginella moellendorffii]|uniref:dihydrolipoyllysine-residue succinyltransferase component of 2-oxoglutarate dehydrogenase complex 1, mitochondrial isoform X2 n=1 Tax=Selaginella moellendorffii TaxID=88036 RepID=UPI000D1CDBC2|nr:dihydrolipoyllysine-residue succinyltransferase component of 2-oxoglutarate dehydrogenase complex 1, mitochondrial isoform X2 [Selaginella moellendorffii]|eukprot:XP_024528133.1 dihydrolipoyllysine-residue succinyltransferase component of 2-oxoglutarate dehydrogenase complex 1, mitochondrial isoform X2 [Selaginella moellendorffii]
MERCRARLARSRSPLLRWYSAASRDPSQRLCLLHLRSYLHTECVDSPLHLRRSQVWNRKVVLLDRLESEFQKIPRRGFAAGGEGDIIVPSMGESISDGSLASFSKQVGDAVNVDDVIAQIESEKVTIDVRSPVAGTLKEIVVKVGTTVKPGDKIAFVAKGDTSGKSSAPPPPPPKFEEKPSPPPKEATAKSAPPPPQPPPPPPPPSSPPLPSTEPQLPPKERERRVPMTRIRKRIATRLKDAQNTLALLTTFNEVDMTNAMALRAKYKDEFQEKHGAKLGFMSVFVKAAVSALQAQPVVNAVIDGDDIIYRDYVDISIAVGTPKGLVVPVVRGCEKMNFADVEKTIAKLAKKANDGTITIDDMAGGSFTISNGGVYGSLISTPIVNPPQSAILGMHSIQKRPVVIGNEIVIRPMMYIALTYDHRLIDGREAVLFLRQVKDVVEDPARLVLDL